MPTTGWQLQKGEKLALFLVFALALVVRMVYLLQIADLPFFDNPVGDSEVYFKRAQQILSGQFRRDSIPFFSSPFYPFYLAFWLGISKSSFFVLRLSQMIFGAANCLLIYWLARQLNRGHYFSALAAGLCGAGYGLLVFFDGKLLSIFLTLFLINLTLLLLLRARETSRVLLAGLAGLSLGLAATDKTNLLLFVPLAAWFLINEFRFQFQRVNYKPAAGFCLGVLLVILPITLNNYLIGRDFVLVSSNLGANLFIGNNRVSQGMMQLPPEFSMTSLDMHLQAELATNRRMKPSESSRYWAGRAWKFLRQNPGAAVRLYIKKLRLLFNCYEVPNHLDFFLIRQDYAPVLKWLFIGFGLIAPLGFLGMLLHLRRGLYPVDKLYIIFAITYLISLLPFFITARYRLPVVSILIAYAIVAVRKLVLLVQKREWKALLWPGVLLLVLTALIHSPLHQRMSYTQSRVLIASTYLERALTSPSRQAKDLERAILGFKQAAELDSFSEDAFYNLGRTYEMIGFYSGAQKMLEKALAINPKRATIPPLINSIQQKYQTSGDAISADKIPQTPLEQARAWEARKNYLAAEASYKKIIREDIYNLQAYNQLGLMYLQMKEYKRAICIFRQALKNKPDNISLMSNLAGVYYRAGKVKLAEKYYQRCLNQQPNNPFIRQQLDFIRGGKRDGNKL